MGRQDIYCYGSVKEGDTYYGKKTACKSPQLFVCDIQKQNEYKFC